MNSQRATTQAGTEPAFQPGVRPAAVWLLMLAAFAISAAYGMLLLLPLFVVDLGGNEANFGLVLSSATVTAVIALVTLTRYPEALRPHLVLALAIGVFGIGSAAATLVTGGWAPLVGVGVLLGTAWAVVYAVAPMVISAMVTDSGRIAYFGYLTGSEQLGIGAGPLLAAALVDTSLGFRGTFAVAAVVCVLAVACTLAVGRLTPDARTTTRSTDPGEEENAPAPIGLGQATRRIARSQTALWLVVIMLFACLFTTMTQFQTTFAAAQDLDYSIFYVAYTIAVIAVRFSVAPWAARYNTTWVIAVSITVMTLALAAFLVVGASSVAYAAASAVLGLGYGLALPAVQAHAVNVTAEEARPRVLPIAGLVFQAAILGFPLAVGWMVVNYGYQPLFTVLIALAAMQVAASWLQVLRHRG